MQGQQGLLRRRRACARQEAAEGERPWPRTLSKRDAAVWVRAVRRFGLEARLPEIAREVGPALEGAPHSALCAPPAARASCRPVPARRLGSQLLREAPRGLARLACPPST